MVIEISLLILVLIDGFLTAKGLSAGCVEKYPPVKLKKWLHSINPLLMPVYSLAWFSLWILIIKNIPYYRYILLLQIIWWSFYVLPNNIRSLKNGIKRNSKYN